MTGSFEIITPLKDFSSVPVDKRFMLRHPRASQDDVHGGFFPHHECDLLSVQASDAELR